MILLTRSVLLICVSVGAGMAAQETVTRLSMDDEQTEDALVATSTAWSTAEGYYDAAEVSQFQLVLAEDVAAVPQKPDGPKQTTAYGPETTQVGSRAGVDNDAPSGGQNAQLHPREFLQDDSPSSEGVGIPSIVVPEPEPSVVRILPPPAKRTPTGKGAEASGSSDRPERASYARTPVRVAPPTSRHTVPPVRRVHSSHESRPYLDPAVAVQRRAALRAEERRRRIEAWKWLGYSPLRPTVGATPFMEGDSRRPAVIIVPYVVHERD